MVWDKGTILASCQGETLAPSILDLKNSELFSGSWLTSGSVILCCGFPCWNQSVNTEFYTSKYCWALCHYSGGRNPKLPLNDKSGGYRYAPRRQGRVWPLPVFLKGHALFFTHSGCPRCGCWKHGFKNKNDRPVIKLVTAWNSKGWSVWIWICPWFFL